MATGMLLGKLMRIHTASQPVASHKDCVGLKKLRCTWAAQPVAGLMNNEACRPVGQLAYVDYGWPVHQAA